MTARIDTGRDGAGRNGAAKTVFVLGAGASYDAQAPLQSELLPLLMEATRRHLGEDHPLRRFRAFLETVFNHAEADDAGASMKRLEDLLTMIDRVAADDGAIKGFEAQEARLLRTAFDATMAKFFYERLLGRRSHPPTNAFAGRLVEERMDGRDWAVISLNWDIILDYALHHQARAKPASTARAPDLDYFVPTHAFFEHSDEPAPGHRPAPAIPLKVLKLHGSLNWLACPQCQRLYVEFDEKIAHEMAYNGPGSAAPCPRCPHHPRRRALLVTPTMLKRLSNVHLQQIWHHAHLEISQAQDVVFIGYSFPQADFEFRYLLARSVRPDARIHVVLNDAEDPNVLARRVQAQADRVPQGPWPLQDLHVFREPAELRYRTFFGNAALTFDYGGASPFMTRYGQGGLEEALRPAARGTPIAR